MERLLQLFASIPLSTFLIILAIFLAAWWFITAVARERRRDMDEIKEEVTGVIGPALDRIIQILEKQDEINRDLLGQNKITKLLSGKSDDDLD